MYVKKLGFLAAVAGLVVSAATSVVLTEEHSCCDFLAKSPIGGRVMTAKDAGFADRAAMHWSLAARLTPRCILLPQDADEVSQAISLLVQGSGTEACRFAVRSGGHTNWPGAADIECGVMLDLGYMNSTTYHPGNQTAGIQPGARWGAVYDTLLPLGVNVAGGRDPTVGVGGFILGGGNSFYASQRGYVCDTVDNFEIVLGNGSIVDANANTNSDLFQVLKGGSSNVGIVTRYDLTTFKAEDLWGGVVVYPFSTLSQQLNALVDFTNNLINDPNGSAIVFLQTSFLSNETAIINAYDYTKPVARAPVYNEFLAISGNTSDSTRIANLSDIVAELTQPAGYRDTFLPITVANNVQMLNEIASIQQKLSTTIRAAQPSGNWTISTLYQPIPALFGEIGVERGGNVMGLDRFTDNLMLWQLYLAWEGADQDKLFNSKGREAIEEGKTYSVANGFDNPFIYLNYADRSQKPLESYGAANVAKIRAASWKYDPTGVFQTLMPGGFKISQVVA